MTRLLVWCVLLRKKKTSVYVYAVEKKKRLSTSVWCVWVWPPFLALSPCFALLFPLFLSARPPSFARFYRYPSVPSICSVC